MSTLKLITFDLDNTLWPVDEVIRKAEKACSDWIADRHPDAARALNAERVRMVRTTLLKENPGYLDNLTALRQDAMTRAFLDAGFRTAVACHLPACSNGSSDTPWNGASTTICTRTNYATPSRPTCWNPPATCVRYRNCSAMPIWPPPRSTPIWTSSIWPRSTMAPIQGPSAARTKTNNPGHPPHL